MVILMDGANGLRSPVVVGELYASNCARLGSTPEVGAPLAMSGSNYNSTQTSASKTLRRKDTRLQVQFKPVCTPLWIVKAGGDIERFRV